MENIKKIEFSTNLTVKYLQQICNECSIKSYGSKIEMIKRIKKKIAEYDKNEERVNEIENDGDNNSDGEEVSDNLANECASDDNDDDDDEEQDSEHDEEYDEIDDRFSAFSKVTVDPSMNDVSINNTASNASTDALKKKRKLALKPIYLPFLRVENKNDAIEVLTQEKEWKMKSIASLACKEGLHEFYRCKENAKCPVKVCLRVNVETEPVIICKSKNIEHVHMEKVAKVWGLNEDTKTAIKHLFKMGTKTSSKIIFPK